MQCYEADLKEKGFSHDPEQNRAVEHSERLYHDLLTGTAGANTKKGILAKLPFKDRSSVLAPPKGLYFWGGVGRGKTHIIDNFYNCLPIVEKTRIHFHSFMRAIHDELKAIKDTQDPLQIVADRFCARSRIICLDEFHVSDITDAMLLGKLLTALFDRGVCLAATSNEHPDELYSGGLQRELFLPAIELIKNHTEVVNVDNGVDYRFRVLEKAEIYHYPLDAMADGILSASFENLSPEPGGESKQIRVEGRAIDTIKTADSVVWFDFNHICDGPRGAADYIEIAKIFQTILISNVPVMDALSDDHARRFMTMIDEFYDRNVKLIISAEAPPEDLYTGANLSQNFKRTVSRLHEMGTKEYLKKQHSSD